MKLVSYKVTMFRNAFSTDPISVQSDVTCLVGKNESGKTAMLEALHRLNPVYKERFDSGDDYPKRQWVADRKAGKVDKTLPIEATFELEDADLDALEEVLGYRPAETSATFYRTYANKSYVLYDVDEAAAVLACFDHLQVSATHRKTLPEGDFAGLAPAAKAALVAIETPSPSDTSRWQNIAQYVEQRLGGKASLGERVRALLWERMPKFFYFDDLHYLPGTFRIADLLDADTHPNSSALQTARSLMELAGADVSTMAQDDYELRTSELRAVGNQITREVKKYWKQNQNLKVLINTDKKTVQTPNGPTAVVSDVKVEVEDEANEFVNNFDQRSSGFRWFFSFLAAFLEFETQVRDGSQSYIVLLDEPAVSLHGHAQKDFLDFIDDRLAPQVQVLYTTHSPFLVEAGHLERIRVVEDRGVDGGGAIVSADASRVSRETLFPLQAALGYDIAQHLFIGPDNLVVEGTSDFTYLQVFSDHLRQLGRTSLDPRWRVLPAGGVSTIPTFVALVGPALDITVLVDSSKQMDRINNLVDDARLAGGRLITCGDITGTEAADIEDIFDPADYLQLYNRTFSTSLDAATLPARMRIIERIGAETGAAFTDHGAPAQTLLEKRDELLPLMSAATLDRFETLFSRINATLTR